MSAEPRDILLMVLREGVGLALIGVILGMGASFWLSRLITSLLYGVNGACAGCWGSVGMRLTRLGSEQG